MALGDRAPSLSTGQQAPPRPVAGAEESEESLV